MSTVTDQTAATGMISLSPSPSTRPSFMSFGYIPIGLPRYDSPGRLFGTPNLLKRLQARTTLGA